MGLYSDGSRINDAEFDANDYPYTETGHSFHLSYKKVSVILNLNVNYVLIPNINLGGLKETADPVNDSTFGH